MYLNVRLPCVDFMRFTMGNVSDLELFTGIIADQYDWIYMVRRRTIKHGVNAG